MTSSKYVSDCFTRGIYELQRTKPLSHWDFNFNFTHKQYERRTFLLFPALNQLIIIIIIICPERKAPTKRNHNQHDQIQCNRFICDFRQFFFVVNFYIFSPNCGLNVQSAHVILSLCPEFSFRILLIPFMTSPQSGVVARSRCMYA